MNTGHPFDNVWASQKDQLKAKKIKLRRIIAIQKSLPKNPKRLSSVKEIWKYYLNHCSYHGLSYWLDEELHLFERIFWVLVFTIGFGCAITIITQLYSEFQSRESNIIIDETNTDIGQVPFPSITVCPFTRVDWIKALNVVNTLIPKGNEKAKQHFLDLLDRSSDIRLSRLQELILDINDSTVLQILNKINMTKVMLDVLPECETFMFNCTWNFASKPCCEMFELQRSYFGFCYSFNSLTSLKADPNKVPQFVDSYGVRSGLRFSAALLNESHIPPSMKALDYQHSMPVMVSDVHVIPVTGRYFSFGNRYYVSLKFTCSNASDEILALEKEPHPPCKHDKGRYRYENCLLQCFGQNLLKQCKCIPSFFLNTPANGDFRLCNVSDMKCISDIATGKDLPFTRKCKCSSECEYVNYNEYTGIVPLKLEDQILIDVHFGGPTGICFKRVRVVNFLDMLVQLGGIFGLFVGGSVISVAELIYNFILTIVYTIYFKCSYFKKNESPKIRPVLESNYQ